MHNTVTKLKNWFTKHYNFNQLLMVFLLVVIGVLLLNKPVFAAGSIVTSIVDFGAGIIQSLIETFIDLYLFFVGSLLTSILIPVLVGIAQYNTFIAKDRKSVV